jgi:cysteine desulfurase family protein (TIGR01976 family)
MTTIPRTAPLLNQAWIRSQFPALELQQDGRPVLYLDNPAGTQVPQRTIDAIGDYLRGSNANVHGAFITSKRTDDMLAGVRQGMAHFLGAASPREIVFGPNMTSLAFSLSRAMGREFGPGDEVVVTDLDHDANIAPWAALAERGVTIRRVPVREDDCTLDMDALANLLSERTRLVAVTYASNAVGSVTDVAGIAKLAHAAGALVWVDAVHYGPHGPIDVRKLDVDFLVCSAYKFFGPHLGILYGRLELLERIQPYQTRPAPHTTPEKYETGTKNHECLAGLGATLEYLAEFGAGTPQAGPTQESLSAAMAAIRDYEKTLSAAMLEGMATVPGLRVYGITDPARLDERVPTFAFNIEGHKAVDVSRKLGEAGIFSWAGNFYALEIMETLGLEAAGGAVRVGAVHYNTLEEIDRLVTSLRAIAHG